MHLSQIMNIQTYWLLHHRYKRRQDFLCCGTTAEFLPCSAPKHPHTTLRKNKIPLSKFSKGFSTSAERKMHFCDHRRLKGLQISQIFWSFLLQIQKSAIDITEIDTVREKNQTFSLSKVQGLIWLPSADISRDTVSKREKCHLISRIMWHKKKWPQIGHEELKSFWKLKASPLLPKYWEPQVSNCF